MIISEKQIMQLLNQLKDHIDLHYRMYPGGNEYQQYLVDLDAQIRNQQSEELKVIE